MSKAKVFMIMPFEGASIAVYDMLKRELEHDYDIIHAGEIGNQQNILEDIFVPLFEYDAIIADLTGLNPNVLYELGVAHSFNKKVIIITQDPIETLPFDLKQYRAKDYDTSYAKFSELLAHIKVNLNGAIDGSVRFGNPVNDFLTKNQSVLVNNQASDSIENSSTEITEKGFLDYMAGIEEDLQSITSDFDHISEEMSTLSSKMDASRELIDQSKNSGTATVSFIRFQAKTVASYIENFSNELRPINKKLALKWNSIEKNTLDLLDSELSQSPNNRAGLTGFLKTLYPLKSNLVNGFDVLTTYIESVKGLIGLEGTLSQKAKSLISDITELTSLYTQIVKSIDRILQKGKYVVGDENLSE